MDWNFRFTNKLSRNITVNNSSQNDDFMVDYFDDLSFVQNENIHLIVHL